jgi:hypothetical protein
LKTLTNTEISVTTTTNQHTGSQNKTERTKNSMTAKTEEIDLTDITRNNSQPTLISITKARREISRQLQSMVCADPQTKDHGQSYLVWEEADWLKKRQVTAPITPAPHPGVYSGTTHLALEGHKTAILAHKRYKEAEAAAKKMIMHAFKEHHFLELQDDNGDVIGYTARELFEHLIDQYVQPEDVADQVTELHKQLEQKYDPTEEPQVYYKAVQDAKLTLESLNQTIDQETLIRHGLNQFKEHLDLRYDIKAWKKFDRADKTWKKFKSHFTKAINDNRNDMSTLKQVGIANAVKEQVNQNKENQQLLAQASDEAHDKIEHLQKQQEQLYAALMAKQPQPQQPLQDNTAATIKALTDKINRLESGNSSTKRGGGGGGSSQGGGKRHKGWLLPNGKDGIRNTRRWDNDNYCWTCGFDIKHNSMTCQYITEPEKHQKQATATNTMNGSTRNLHLRT